MAVTHCTQQQQQHEEDIMKDDVCSQISKSQQDIVRDVCSQISKSD